MFFLLNRIVNSKFTKMKKESTHRGSVVQFWRLVEAFNSCGFLITILLKKEKLVSIQNVTEKWQKEMLENRDKDKSSFLL